MPPPRRPRLDKIRFRCVFGLLTLSVRVLEEAPVGRLDVRVVARRPGASAFERALLIPPGAVLKLVRAGGETRFVQARAFTPRRQYRGRCVAGGTVELIGAIRAARPAWG